MILSFSSKNNRPLFFIQKKPKNNLLNLLRIENNNE